MSLHHALLHVHEQFMQAQANAKRTLQQDLRNRTQQPAREHALKMHAYKQVSLQQFKNIVNQHEVSYEKLQSLTPAKKKKVIATEADVIELEQKLQKLLEKPRELAVTDDNKVFVKQDALTLMDKIKSDKNLLAQLTKKS